MTFHNLYETKALQNPAELEKFLNLLEDESVCSYLEIGCKYGGSLWQVATVLPKGARIVAVSIPTPGITQHLQECVQRLKTSGYDTRLILGDSINPKTVAKVAALGPFDACLIDANHTEPYVRADWKNYGPMAKIVAFHDISWIAEERAGKFFIDVPKVWEEIKNGYRHQEIKMDPTKRDNGFGILWR